LWITLQVKNRKLIICFSHTYEVIFTWHKLNEYPSWYWPCVDIEILKQKSTRGMQTHCALWTLFIVLLMSRENNLYIHNFHAFYICCWYIQYFSDVCSLSDLKQGYQSLVLVLTACWLIKGAYCLNFSQTWAAH